MKTFFSSRRADWSLDLLAAFLRLPEGDSRIARQLTAGFLLAIA